MGSAEFAEWMAVYDRQPWGWERIEMMFGFIMSLLFNSNLTHKTKHKAKAPKEFMFFAEAERKRKAKSKGQAATIADALRAWGMKVVPKGK